MTVPPSPREAALTILQHVQRQPPLRVPLDDALDAVLAEDVISPLDIPAWPNAAMDGFAARAEDVRGASEAGPRHLRVLEAIPAGGVPRRRLVPGTCARIFTGAPVPDGADSVIRQEDTDQGEESVAVFRDRDAGVNIRQAGEDIRAGTLVLAVGTELGPAALGVLASVARGEPLIYRQPRVGILASGDEIVDVDQPDEILSGRKVASSNSHTLKALVRRAGGEPISLGIARDSPGNLRLHFEAARECDLLVTTGGISVGQHDHMRAVMAALGAELKFWRIRMRPGAPVGFGLLDRLPWVGLPGNPVSAMVTFELFVRPAIRRMSGRALPFRRTTPVRLTETVRVAGSLQHFLRVTLSHGTGLPEARLTGSQSSGVLTSMARADALVIIPEGQPETPAGAEAQAIVLDEPRHQAEPPF